ncbi:hypothetical protein [Wenyingzhuangia sp. IMCC45574]
MPSRYKAIENNKGYFISTTKANWVKTGIPNPSHLVFKNLIMDALNNNFTTIEMEQIIDEYVDKPYIPILRLKVRNEIHLVSEEFNEVLLNQINNILAANNYQPI